MSWWNSQPVVPNRDTPLWGAIAANIPRFEPHPRYEIYRLNLEYLYAVLEFINSNYLYGYRLYPDYFQRKIDFPGSLALVLMDGNKLIGFIYSSPITIHNNECAYVDLMTVHKSYRNQGLAKVLISAITNFSNLKHFIHKKDKNQLPFPYFYKTQHFSGHIPSLVKKYAHSPQSGGVNETDSDNLAEAMVLYAKWLNKQPEFKPIVSLDTFKSSSSVKTFFNKDAGTMFSFSIFEFQVGFLKKSKIAEIFFINKTAFHLELYVSMMHCLHALNVEYAVIQKTAFFAKIIETDKYIEGMDLYLHSYNLNVPPCQNIQLPVL